MTVFGHAAGGFKGQLIQVEVDIRKGIPRFDIVGLPDSAVRESRARVRAAVRNSGFQFPRERVLVNLQPAGLKKVGSGLDLAIALAVLYSGRQVRNPAAVSVMAVGELQLDGRVRVVPGAAAAAASAHELGLSAAILPEENFGRTPTCRLLTEKGAHVYPVKDLTYALHLLMALAVGSYPDRMDLLGCDDQTIRTSDPGNRDGYVDRDCMPEDVGPDEAWPGAVMKMTSSGTDPDAEAGTGEDYRDMVGAEYLKDALIIAAAGGHHVLMFGPPGSGKTMALKRYPSILPPLDGRSALESARIQALNEISCQLRASYSSENAMSPPVVYARYGSRKEDLFGVKGLYTGDAVLAHRGVLVLDEVPGVHPSVLQTLRDVLDRKRVEYYQGGRVIWFPADMQVLMALNACSCGRLGSAHSRCICTPADIQTYWKRIGLPLIDRIDIRIPVPSVLNQPARSISFTAGLLSGEGEGMSSAEMLERAANAGKLQRLRFEDCHFSRNVDIPPEMIDRFCRLDNDCRDILHQAVGEGIFSARAVHGVLRTARSSADADDSGEIREQHLLKAIELRRYGEGDYFWKSFF